MAPRLVSITTTGSSSWARTPGGVSRPAISARPRIRFMGPSWWGSVRSAPRVVVAVPRGEGWPLLRPGQILFTYFHFAADEKLTRAVMDSGATAIAYETIRDPRGQLPLLTPMSEVAGRMSIQEGAKFLERPFEGRGILLGGVPGVLPANVVIL